MRDTAFRLKRISARVFVCMNTKEVMMMIIGLIKVCMHAIKFNSEEDRPNFKRMLMSTFTAHVSNGFF